MAQKIQQTKTSTISNDKNDITLKNNFINETDTNKSLFLGLGGDKNGNNLLKNKFEQHKDNVLN
jgi:hypothetical protein